VTLDVSELFGKAKNKSKFYGAEKSSVNVMPSITPDNKKSVASHFPSFSIWSHKMKAFGVMDDKDHTGAGR
jgi:hypothetical protein